MLPIADRWFETCKMSDDITLLWEPHVVPLMRCNIWHVRGRDRDLMIDTGMGIASLREAAARLLDKQVTAVATHTHTDHVGSYHEFEHTLVHELEADELRSPRDRGTLLASVMGDDEIAKLAKAGYPFDGDLITALPSAGYDMARYRLQDAPVTEIVAEGDVVDIGNRHFEVLHLPGHSPGGIGLWEAKTGTLFSGDAIYDGRCWTRSTAPTSRHMCAPWSGCARCRSRSCMPATIPASAVRASSNCAMPISRNAPERVSE